MTYQLLTRGLLLVLSLSAINSVGAFRDFVKKIHENQATFMEKFPLGPDKTSFQHRFLEDINACDAAFLDCIDDSGCVDCFSQLDNADVDWSGGMPSDTSCDDFVKIFQSKGYCKKMKGSSKETFCKTHVACTVYNDDDYPDEDEDSVYSDDDEVDPAYVNCTALETCEWEGMHKNWIGDGICHDNIHGCYNTAICGWDGGDCCEDTCESDVEDEADDDDWCGHDGYFCRDPLSKSCDPVLNKSCPGKSPDPVKCRIDEDKYRLIMYDSFGDGWDDSKVTITPKKGKGTKIFEGGLEDGAEGLEYICLSKEPQCYNAVTSGGVWGVESSWEIKPLREGSIAIAGSGAPNDCDFSVAGGCETTCNGRPDNYPPNSEENKRFKKMYKCVEDKCLIQIANCESNKVCSSCLEEKYETPEYCYSNELFAAVVDCSVCKCTERMNDPFCQAGPPEDPNEDKLKKCTAAETIAGTKAVMSFSKCSDIGQLRELITEFDNDNFGALDTFETCAHSYADDYNHGGRTALSCLKILYDAMSNPIVKDKPNAPKEAIMAFASHLYNDGESFCDCAKKSSEDCPLCPAFMNFKTLLYEAMDACISLDAIDCDSWNEFWKPCQTNLANEFGASDFSSQDQCDYAKSGCGGAGNFPAFRRLDCGAELDEDAWSYYGLFADRCVKGASPVTTPTLKPAKSPTIAPVGRPTTKPYVPDTSPVPYIPPSEPYTPPSSSNSNYTPTDSKASGKKKGGHFFRNFFIFCLLGAGGYYVYKKRFDTFDFVQYRRSSRFGGGGYNMMFGGESQLYDNMNSSTTFEPPSLPPVMMGTEMT